MGGSAAAAWGKLETLYGTNGEDASDARPVGGVSATQAPQITPAGAARRLV